MESIWMPLFQASCDQASRIAALGTESWLFPLTTESLLSMALVLGFPSLPGERRRESFRWALFYTPVRAELCSGVPRLFLWKILYRGSAGVVSVGGKASACAGTALRFV